jgi:Arc/MetJ-type ribon-helix-helix transcriptional regulator
LDERKKGKTYWNIEVDKPLNEALENAIKVDWHRTKSEFIRALVRRKLEEMGYRSPRVSQAQTEPNNGVVRSADA